MDGCLAQIGQCISDCHSTGTNQVSYRGRSLIDYIDIIYAIIKQINLIDKVIVPKLVL